MNFKTKTAVVCAVPLTLGASVLAQAELLRRMTGEVKAEYLMMASGGVILMLASFYLVAYVARNFDDDGKPDGHE